MNDMHTAALYQAMDRYSDEKLAETGEALRDLPAINMRIIEASSHAHKIAQALSVMANGHYGPIPESGCAENAGQPNGNVAEAAAALDHLDRNLHFLSAQAERLSRL